MTDSRTRRLVVSTFLVLLHLPLIFYAHSLYVDLGPSKSLLDIGPVSGILLIVFVALPHVVLSITGIKWNPTRAHPGEML